MASYNIAQYANSVVALLPIPPSTDGELLSRPLASAALTYESSMGFFNSLAHSSENLFQSDKSARSPPNTNMGPRISPLSSMHACKTIGVAVLAQTICFVGLAHDDSISRGAGGAAHGRNASGRSCRPIPATSRPARAAGWPLSVEPVSGKGVVPSAFLGPWRGFCLRRCGCGLDRAQHRPARPTPPASSARCWCRCRPTARPRDRNCALVSAICLTMANRSKVLRARRSIRVTVTTSPGPRRSSIRRSSRRSARAPVTFSR